MVSYSTEAAWWFQQRFDRRCWPAFMMAIMEK
jgi:hypothetical protein